MLDQNPLPCGTLEARWDSQYVLAIDIQTGVFTEVEEWIKTKTPEKYDSGKNPGALLAFINKDVVLYANTKRHALGGLDEE